MKKSEIRTMIKEEMIKEGMDYGLKYGIRDKVRSAINDITANMEFYYSEDDEMDYKQAHKKAIEAYKKWAKVVFEQLKKLKEETRSGSNIYDVTFKKNKK